MAVKKKPVAAISALYQSAGGAPVVAAPMATADHVASDDGPNLKSRVQKTVKAATAQAQAKLTPDAKKAAAEFAKKQAAQDRAAQQAADRANKLKAAQDKQAAELARRVAVQTNKNLLLQMKDQSKTTHLSTLQQQQKDKVESQLLLKADKAATQANTKVLQATAQNAVHDLQVKRKAEDVALAITTQQAKQQAQLNGLPTATQQTTDKLTQGILASLGLGDTSQTTNPVAGYLTNGMTTAGASDATNGGTVDSGNDGGGGGGFWAPNNVGSAAAGSLFSGKTMLIAAAVGGVVLFFILKRRKK